MKQNTSIGKYINRQLEVLGKSARQAAREAKISSSYISKIMSGERLPSPRILKRLASALQTPYEVLMKEAGYWPKPLEQPAYVVAIIPEEALRGLNESDKETVRSAMEAEGTRLARVLRDVRGETR